MDHFIVVMGDIVESKKLKPVQRKKVQKQLRAVFREINKSSDGLQTTYSITLGDEFQSVYRKSSSLFNDVWSIKAAIYPVRVRIAIGAGEITTDTQQEKSLMMDGPAFHKTRDLINKLKDENLLISVETGDLIFDQLANSSLNILAGNLKNWSKNRFTILKMKSEGYSVKEIAGELKISEVAVYKNIHAGKLNHIEKMTEAISKRMDALNTQTEGVSGVV